MREEGQTMAEYGVVLTVITVAIITAFAVFSDRIELSILRVVNLVPT
jgi:Flp pilus assembly pilin Flp